MIIENRHNKPYSEKLFNELCIMYLLMDSSNVLDSYVLDRHFGKSKRTLYRYIEDINASCPFLDLHFEGKNRHRYLTSSVPKGYDSNDLERYIIDTQRHKDISNARLCRCISMLASNLYSLQEENYIDKENLNRCRPDDYVIINDERYVFVGFDLCDELYEKISLRTKQRDARLVKNVLIYSANIE